MRHIELKQQIANYMVLTTKVPLNVAEQILDQIDRQLETQRCVYCNEPLGQEAAQLRGSMPIHTKCNEEMEQEMAMWEETSGITDDQFPYDPAWNSFQEERNKS